MFADHWMHVSSHSLVYNANSRIHDICSVASHEDLLYVQSLDQVFSVMMVLATNGRAAMAWWTRQLL